ncbi:glycosyltransferase family 39 protein [Candidatus Roizmanbacteria bacterium]|nr:MAG: glycosyltransferase family 39 protein [Candidatus Roizmanbacteria bacterium]
MTAFFKKFHIWILLISAFAIRLIHLDQSLWLDEATTAVTVQRYSFWEIVTQFSPADFHPPLYYLFMDIWTSFLGYSEIALRMPSVIFSVAAGYFVYKAARRLFPATEHGLGAAVLSAVFFLFNPLIVYYAQEARMYAFVTFLVAANFYYLLTLMTRKVPNSSLYFHLTLGAMFLTFYASIFYIGAVILYLLYHKKYPLLVSAVTTVLASITVVFPLLYTQYTGSKTALEAVKNWSLVLGTVSLKNIILIPIKFTSGRISFEPKVVYYILAGVWALLSFYLASLLVIPDLIRNLVKKRAGSQVKPGMTLAYFFLTPLLLGTVFSFISPLLQYFRFQFLLVFLSILLGVSASRLKSDVYKYAIVAGFIAWSFLYLLVPQFHREDWKLLALSLKNETKPIYMIESSSDPLTYYADSIRTKPLRDIVYGEYQEEDMIVIPYTSDIHGINYSIILQGNNLCREVVPFRELTFERWKKC